MSHSQTSVLSGIQHLHKTMQIYAKQLMKLAKQRELDVKIYETIRLPERQLYLFEKKYTQLKTGSMHEYGAALDAIFKGNDPWGNKHPWDKLGQIGKDLGLCWGGNFKGAWDRPHFQLIPAQKTPQKKIRQGKFPKPYPEVLKKGDYGDLVKILQTLIIRKGIFNLTADGIFGNKTQMAVEKVQYENKLTIDGVVWGGVWKALV